MLKSMSQKSPEFKIYIVFNIIWIRLKNLLLQKEMSASLYKAYLSYFERVTIIEEFFLVKKAKDQG